MKRVQLEIVFGTVLIFLSAAILLVMGINEKERLAKYEIQQKAEQIEFGASVFEINCVRCHGSHAQGTALAPCLRCPELFTTRLKEVGWEGSLEDYIISVVTVGRQISTRPAQYPGGGSPAMPTWSEKFGGPLRDDQIRAVAAFIMNFEEWAMSPELVPTPVEPLVADTPEALGRQAFAAAGCVACHTITGVSTGTLGPVLDGLATRAGDTVAGLTAEEYIRQSILEPSAFVVEGFNDGVMPATFGTLLTEEQIENLIAFLLTLTD